MCVELLMKPKPSIIDHVTYIYMEGVHPNMTLTLLK
jgi:hypothetical protein